jgi:hypothetical protein
MLAGCGSKQSQLVGRWTNTVPPDTSGGINYRVYIAWDPAGWVSIEFLNDSKVNITSRGGEGGVSQYTIIGDGRIELVGKLFNYQVDGNKLKLTDSNGAITTFILGDQSHVQQTGGIKESAEIIKTKAQAEIGDAKAQCYLGFCYAEGKGVTKDYLEAAKWFRKSAEQGFGPAQENLGTYYTFGNGVPKDYDEAAKWFRKAAEQGLAQSQFNLGYCCYVGQGVIQDYGEAAKWFGKAAEQGLAAAQFNLGLAYAKGQGVMQNNQEAYIWLWIAAEQNYQGAASQRDIVASLLSQREITDAVVKANGRNLAIIVKQTQDSISNNLSSGPASKIR